MTADPLTLEELTKFGVQLEDEGPHAFDPEVEWWNESWFWDWFDSTGRVAGHCRIGVHPNQERAWVWFYLYRDGEWVAVAEPRLPLLDLKLDDLSYDRWGLRFSYRAGDPLRSGHLSFEGFGRVVSGPRTGMILPVGAELEIASLGAPHAPPKSNVAGHSSETYPSSRFEQPISARGTLRLGPERLDFDGRGERDHSWGPRHWNLEWTVIVVNGEDLRMLCHDARVPNVGRFAGGYLHREKSISIPDVHLDLEFHDEDLQKPVSGRFSVKAEDGTVVEGSIEVISAAEIDLSHTLVPPQRSIYRRSLIRVRRAEGAPLLGWMEFHRFLGED
jgi:hypothetical protein